MNLFIFFILKSVKRFVVSSKANHYLLRVTFLSFFLVHCAQQPVNENVRKISSIDKVASFEKNQQNYAYEACRSQSRLYLEDQILRMPEEYTQDHTNEWSQSIPLRCIQFAQRNFVGNFAKCENADSKPNPLALRPCLTENYVYLAYNAYHDVMDCFNLNPQDFFLQIMIESGFHINAINRNGYDSGMAQFTKSGIQRVSENDRIERTRRVLLESSRPSCQRIASTVGAFDNTSMSIEKRCSMIVLPQNPYRGMLYNYLHTMLDQIDISKQLESEFVNDPALQNIITPKIKRQLVYLAYNRGLTGMKRLLLGYIENRKAMSQVLTEQLLDLDQNLNRVKNILSIEPNKREQLLKAKIKKLSFAEYAVIHNANYVADMIAAQDYVRRYLGDQCSRF